MTRPGACPVCGRLGRITAISRDALSRMASSLAVELPADFIDLGARVLRCPQCTLEFAKPMRAPGPRFYLWLTRSGFRYPVQRWEWDACANRIAARAAALDRELRVLDVGCGDGGFIKRLAEVPQVAAVGVDQNPEIVERCRLGGLDAREGGIEAAGTEDRAGYDAITLWHVVEHVDDPVHLLVDARNRLAANGEIFFSVPLTPMSYEGAWPDPFNEPPHHLTRWNLRALEALASRLCMKAEFILPIAEGLATRTMKSLMLQAMPVMAVRGRAHKALLLIAHLLRHPAAPFNEYFRQKKRAKRKGLVLPDVVLVRLTAPRVGVTAPGRCQDFDRESQDAS